MIDIKLVRENSDLIKDNIRKKFQKEKTSLVDKVIKLDDDWRKIKYDGDKIRASRNKISEEINKAKKSRDERQAKALIKKAKEIPEKIAKNEKKANKIYSEIKIILSQLPNIISKRVPIGEDESKNKVEEKIGKPIKFSFPVKTHTEIAENLGMADFDSSGRVSGTGFYYLEGDLALLNQALINYSRDIMVKEGFTYVETPLMLREEIIDRVTDLNDKEKQIYLVKDDDLALIGTSEHSLIGRFIDQTIDQKKLPLKQTSYSMCFRKEIGSHGLDEKGLFRTHQFNKIEMVVICKPEESEKFFEQMKKISIKIFKGLGIPIRVLKICSGDLGDLKYEQVDIEAYFPRRKDYFEVGSCSNLTDAQARKLGISTRIKGERIIPHTLNNTAMATSRALVAILENFQQKDGSVKIPKVLQKYMSGKKKLEIRKN